MTLLMKVDNGLCCHFNGHFVGCIIYADYITLLAPLREALNYMLDVCREYTEAYDILFKTNGMCFERTDSTLFDKDVQVIGPTQGACSLAVLAINTRPMTSALRMPSTHPAIRNTNHR